ncbi:MAG: hypothetical protein P8Y58_04100 [Novosphingobium sp.]
MSHPARDRELVAPIRPGSALARSWSLTQLAVDLEVCAAELERTSGSRRRRILISALGMKGRSVRGSGFAHLCLQSRGAR